MRRVYAQNFKVTGLPSAVDSLYITKIGIMFRKKHGTAGVSIAICETINGIPDQTRVLIQSRKHLLNHEITAVYPASDLASNLTVFSFDGQVQLFANKEYSVIIQPDAGRVSYKIWRAVIGNPHLGTTRGLNKKVTQPTGPITFTGLYKSRVNGKKFELGHNGTKVFLQMAFYKSNFGGWGGGYDNGGGGPTGGSGTNTSISGSVTFVNTPDLDFFNVTSLTSNSILSGDILVGGNSTVANALQNSVVTQYNPVDSTIYVRNSTGNFASNTFIQIVRLGESNYSNISTLQTAIGNTQLTTKVANGTLVTVFNLPYHAVVPKITTNLPSGTSYDVSISTILGANASYAQIPAVPAVNNVDTELSDYKGDRYIISYSNNPTLSYPSLSMTINMTSNNQYQSPAVKPTDMLLITNSIDPTGGNTAGEWSNYGNAQTKYVSNPIVLSSGNDADDLKVYITAYRPSGTDVQLYSRFLSGQDPAPISEKTWTSLVNDTPSVYSDQLNKENYIEYSFSMANTVNNPTTYLIGTGLITTANTSNVISGNVTTSNTSFNTQLQPGQLLYNSSNVFLGKISTITNSSSLTLTSNATLTVTSGVFNYSTSGYIPPQTNAFLNVGNLVTKTGNLSVSNSSATVTGTGTLFTSELAVTNYINVNGEQKYIVSIANTTSLTVDSPFLYTNSNISYSQVLPSGVTYTDSNGTTYVQYNQFQIKAVWYADTGVLYPKLKDLRAIALQN
jgi:hypothetical protein